MIYKIFAATPLIIQFFNIRLHLHHKPQGYVLSHNNILKSMAMNDKAICMWAKCEVRDGYGGDHKIPVTPNGGITKLDTRMIGGITKIP